MACPYFIEEERVCVAEMAAKKVNHVPNGIELKEFCRSDKYELCYRFFVNKDTRGECS